MQTSSSANRTCSEFSSASEYTATVLIPSSRQAQITRSAISPRLAIRIFLNIASDPARFDGEQPFAILDRLAVLDVRTHDLALVFRGDLVHQLHRFDDAEYLVFLDVLANLHERGRTRLGRTIERADDRGLHDRQLEGGLVRFVL